MVPVWETQHLTPWLGSYEQVIVSSGSDPCRTSLNGCHPLTAATAILSKTTKKELLVRIRERGGFSPIYERVAAGETLTKIAKSYGCSRQLLRQALTKGEARIKLFADAQRDAAYAHAEDGLQILDDAPTLTREEVAKAKERAAYRRWLASKLDRETFGDTPLVQLNDNRTNNTFEFSWLQALRAPTKALPPAPSESAAALPPVEAEIVVEERHHGYEVTASGQLGDSPQGLPGDRGEDRDADRDALAG